MLILQSADLFLDEDSIFPLHFHSQMKCDYYRNKNCSIAHAQCKKIANHFHFRDFAHSKIDHITHDFSTPFILFAVNMISLRTHHREPSSMAWCDVNSFRNKHHDSSNHAILFALTFHSPIESIVKQNDEDFNLFQIFTFSLTATLCCFSVCFKWISIDGAIRCPGKTVLIASRQRYMMEVIQLWFVFKRFLVK